MLESLTAISPVDGRYRNKTEKLADYFSEAALIRYRIRVEIEYFIACANCRYPNSRKSTARNSKHCVPSTPNSRSKTPAASRKSRQPRTMMSRQWNTS